MGRGSYCIVRNCCNNKFSNPEIAFFTLPTDSLRAKKWLQVVNREDLLKDDVYRQKNYRVCSSHFEDTQFKKIYPRKMLWSNALPTVLKDFGEKTQERATVNVPQNDNKGDLNTFTSHVHNRKINTSRKRKVHQVFPEASEPADIDSETISVTDTISTGAATVDLIPPSPDTDMSEETKVVVREAKREDMYQVCDLIRALAEFEKLENQMKINAETLITDGFDTDSPAFKCFVAEVGESSSIIGYAIYYTCYSTWLGKSIFLEDLYVTPSYRSCGIGKELILSVAKVAYETSKRLDFHVLSWNPAKEFYKSLGAINLTDSEKWQLYRLDENSLNKLFDN